MKRFWIAFVFLATLFASSNAFAQTSIAVNIDKAKLQWQWDQGAGAPANGFDVKCGQASGVYTKVTIVTPSTIKEVTVKDTISGPGSWFCAVSAFNEFGDSNLSNEVTFRAGIAPNDPSTLIIISN